MENEKKEFYPSKEMLDKIKRFRLFDDTFMTKCFEENIKCTEFVLRIILDKHDLAVIKVDTQHGISNLKGHSIRLDIFAKDAKGVYYDIEVQRSDEGAIPKRARYNSSLIDANVLKKGVGYDKLPESYVIFIAENDVLAYDRPVYHIDRTIRETGTVFDDEAHIVYVNGAWRADDAIGHLMHDFSCSNPADMNYSLLAETTQYFKENQEGVRRMCKGMEELIETNNKRIALKMLKKGYSVEEIAEVTELDEAVINKMKEENLALA